MLHSSSTILQSLRQFLNVSAKVASNNLGIARLDGLENRIVNEHILVLGLDHIVALGAQARHVTIDVNSVDMLYPLKGRIDNYEGSSATHAGAKHQQLPRTRLVIIYENFCFSLPSKQQNVFTNL
jgi:hypothetical protein